MSVPGYLPGALTRNSGCLCGIILLAATVCGVAAWPDGFRKDIARSDLPKVSARWGFVGTHPHSHSIVPGGLLVIS
jgi:hypothetical protein